MLRSFFIIVAFVATLSANSCIKCHQSQMDRCKKSNHYTLKSAINITRKAFGIKDSNVTLQTLPKPKSKITKVQDIVDDMLRRKCLRCHLNSKTINSSGNLCLSCHNSHKSVNDSYKARPTMSKCLKCHNGEFIGSDFLGKFPHDYDKAYRSPLTKDGYYPDSRDGIDYHYLSADVHYKMGFSCISCHNNKNGNWERVSCKDCHKSLSKANHKSYHKNLSCTSCHASWMVNSYQLHLLRDDTPNYKQWKRLTKQFDLYLEEFLKNALKQKNPPPPKMPDYLTNELKDGIWYSGWKFRRWENFILVRKDNQKIALAKPMFEYFISYVDKNGTTILDSVSMVNGKKIESFLPKSPHTITKLSKSCEMCHNNQIMLNKNYINRDLFIGNTFKSRLLNKKELKKLNSSLYKKERAKMLFDSF